MVDSFVLLAPLILLGVIAVLGFVGCASIVGIEDFHPTPTDPERTESPPDPPTNLTAAPGDAEVYLTWDVVTDAIEYHVLRSMMSGSVASDYPDIFVVLPTELPWTDKLGLVNGTAYFYRVSAVNSVGQSDLSEEVSATPTWPVGAFITKVTFGTPRGGENALFGMEIQIGAADLTVQTLGRAFALGVTTQHEIKLVDAATATELGHAFVDASTVTDGDFIYGPLKPSPVTVTAGKFYYIVSVESTGGDQFYDQDTTVQTQPDAVVTHAVFSGVPGTYVLGAAGHPYGPVNFQY